MDVQMSFPLSPRPFDHVIMWFLGKRRMKKNKEKNMRMYRTFCTEDTGKVLFNFKVLRKDIFHVFEPDLSFSPNFLLGPPFSPSSITLCGKVGQKNRPEKRSFSLLLSSPQRGANPFGQQGFLIPFVVQEKTSCCETLIIFLLIQQKKEINKCISPEATHFPQESENQNGKKQKREKATWIPPSISSPSFSRTHQTLPLPPFGTHKSLSSSHPPARFSHIPPKQFRSKSIGGGGGGETKRGTKLFIP